MAIIIQGKVLQFSFLVLSSILIYYFIEKSKGDWVPDVRRLPFVDAIDESIGRAVEMGRTVMYTHGTGRVQTSAAAGTLAALSVLPYVLQKCAQNGITLLLPTGDHVTYSILQELSREYYTMEGHPELYNPDAISYLSQDPRAYSTGVMQSMYENNIGGAILLGSYHHAGLMVVETANRVGAMTVGGTDSLSQIPWFVAGCSYSIIGEELYALSAYISREDVQLGSIFGQDVLKALILIAIILGVIFVQMNLNISWLFEL
jgi:hypothetical protein